jgi:hypothetical protein
MTFFRVGAKIIFSVISAFPDAPREPTPGPPNPKLEI